MTLELRWSQNAKREEVSASIYHYYETIFVLELFIATLFTSRQTGLVSMPLCFNWAFATPPSREKRKAVTIHIWSPSLHMSSFSHMTYAYNKLSLILDSHGVTNRILFEMLMPLLMPLFAILSDNHAKK